MELFKLFGKIVINKGTSEEDIDKLNKKAKDLGEKFEKVGTGFKNAGDKMQTAGQKLLPVSTAIGGLGILCTKSAADVKAMNSQFEQTFGDMQSQASSAMNRVAEDSGILQTRLQGIGTSIYAFAKASGADSSEAMALMETSLQATADAAAYYDRSLEDTAESLQSFLKGNFENDAALGLSCTETTRNAAAMELFGEKYNDLSEIQKQQTLLKMVTDAQELSGAMGQASREQDGLENVTGNLTESARLLGAELGTVILPIVVDLMQKATEFLQNLNNMDEGTKKMIVTVGAVLAAAGPVLMFLGNVATGVGSIISVGGKLAGGIGSLIGKVSGAGGLISALAAIPAPVWVIIGVIGAVIAIGVALYKNWDEIREWAGRTWENIKNTVGGAVDAIKGFFGGIIDFAKNNWQGLALLLVNPFVGGFKLLYDNCDTFRNFIDNFLGNLKEGFHNFTSNISEKAGELKDNVVNKARELKDGAVEKFNELKDNATEKIENLKENATEKFNQLKDRAVEKVENLKENAVEKFKQLKEKATEKVNALKENAVNKFNELKDKAGEKVNTLKENAVSKFNELKDQAAGKIDALKEKGIAGFEALKAKGLEKFDRLKSGISEKLESVKNFVSSTVQKLKDFFHFDWKLPEIKVPHFKINGSFSLNPPSIPYIDVKWYKKAMDAPVIMDKPTAFGINPAGQIMAGGEAGSEVVSGTQTLMNMISAAVADNNGQLYEMLSKLYALLSEYLPVYADRQMVLDTGALVGELAQPMYEELGWIAHMRGRRN